MRISFGILFLAFFALVSQEANSVEVTHEDIRGTIQSLIYSYNQLDNKLERHEHRERALGELLKKAMQSLQKGQKNLEPINGIFGRLDERVSQIETMLIAQEEKYNVQTEKLGEALEHIFKWMRENDECYKRPPPLPLAAANEATTPTAAASVGVELMKEQKSLNKDVLEKMTQLSLNVQTLLNRSQEIMRQTEVAFKSAPSTAEMLSKIEDKLISYSVATPPSILEPTNNVEFENTVLEKFGELSAGINEIQKRAAPQFKEGLTIDDRAYIEAMNNETLNALEHLKIDALSASDKVLTKLTTRIKETESNIASNVSRVSDGVNDSSELLEKLYNEINASYTNLNDGLDVLTKFNNILMTNSEYVLETQRKVEFGTHQVVQKIADLLEKQRSDVTAMMNERFNAIDEGIVTNHMEAMQNLSSLMELEISHVWRQIEIMASEISESKELLHTMQGKTELYVNTTFATIGGMDDKVQQITSRIIDLETNLNYLLGRLSVMSQEFAQIKTGLGEALDQIRDTFHSVQDKLSSTDGNGAAVKPTQGGPSHIAGNEYETELKLLKRNAV